MERLTDRKTSCWIKTKSGKDYTNYTQDWDAINKLAEYEDAGLTPEQIRELKDRDTAKTPEEYDGHWYKCPRCGKYAGGLKGNFCHVCGQRIRWEE